MIHQKSILARNRVLSMVMALGMIIALLIPMFTAAAEDPTAAPATDAETGPAHGDQCRLCSL